MEVSMEAKRNGVAFRRPTFKNPLPKMFKLLGKVLMTVFVGIIAFGESAGRARAAAELSRQGFHEEAKRLILREDLKDV
jgi:hypothetical protein